MNCLEFRRRLAAEPFSAASDFVRHRQDCAACADASARAADFELRLRRALQVAAPSQLAESVLLAQATTQYRRVALVRRGGLVALAALLVLALGIGMRVEARPLPAQAVDHLLHEADVLTSTQRVSDDAVRAAFAKRGITLREVPDAVITFIGCCPMGRHRTVHLVSSQDGVAVTVLYVVDERVSRREDFERDGWHGRSVPLGAGTLILLARDTAPFDHVETLWHTALQG